MIIVDGLDSCEQDKVLYILDAMHTLFSDANAPFVTVLAIDPHIIIRVRFFFMLIHIFYNVNLLY